MRRIGAAGLPGLAYAGFMPAPRIPLSHLAGPGEPERKFRLMEVVRRTMRERRYSRRTEEAYVSWFRRYLVFSGRRHPADLDVADVRASCPTWQLRSVSRHQRRIRRLRQSIFCMRACCVGHFPSSMGSSLRRDRGGCPLCSRRPRCGQSSGGFGSPTG